MISVIIPCYNAEETIESCFNSLIQQTYADWELIFIDDGSSDQTLAKLHALKASHEELTIKVLHQANQGVSSARNLGLGHISGDFIAFVDADDSVEQDYLAKLYEAFEDPSVSLAVCSYTAVDMEQQRKTVYSIKAGLFSKDQALEYLIAEKGPQGYLWNKLFLASVIKESSLVFHREIFMAEDLLFVAEYLIAMMGTIKIIDDPLYRYMIFSNSSNKTRLASLQEGYDKYFDNFLDCMDRIEQLIPSDLPRARKAVLARKGRIAIQYLRANYLMKKYDKAANLRLRQLAKDNKEYFFSSVDANEKTKMIYNLVLYLPRLAYLRDKRHFK